MDEGITDKGEAGVVWLESTPNLKRCRVMWDCVEVAWGWQVRLWGGGGRSVLLGGRHMHGAHPT